MAECLNSRHAWKRVGVAYTSGLSTDSPTRWNSTYLMLKSALKYQPVFVNLHLVDGTYTLCPSLEVWKRAEKNVDS
jgi:hypothetical protein